MYMLRMTVAALKMGKGKPELREGEGLWDFVGTLALDLMVMSRAEST